MPWADTYFSVIRISRPHALPFIKCRSYLNRALDHAFRVYLCVSYGSRKKTATAPLNNFNRLFSVADTYFLPVRYEINFYTVSTLLAKRNSVLRVLRHWDNTDFLSMLSEVTQHRLANEPKSSKTTGSTSINESRSCTDAECNVYTDAIVLQCTWVTSLINNGFWIGWIDLLDLHQS
jgi:hypothetical protein